MTLRKFSWLFLALLLCFVLLSAFAEEEIAPVEKYWFCLNCSSAGSGYACPHCGTVRGVWTCFGCGTENLSDTCRFCGKGKTESLHDQASCDEPLRAWPAVRYLADQGNGDALCALAGYYASGLMVEQDAETALDCYRKACDAGSAEAWLLLGKVYDRGELVERDEFTAMECFQKPPSSETRKRCGTSEPSGTKAPSSPVTA